MNSGFTSLLTSRPLLVVTGWGIVTESVWATSSDSVRVCVRLLHGTGARGGEREGVETLSGGSWSEARANTSRSRNLCMGRWMRPFDVLSVTALIRLSLPLYQRSISRNPVVKISASNRVLWSFGKEETQWMAISIILNQSWCTQIHLC